MKVLPVNKVKVGMRLAQNIYRHDSLLALPKGIVLRGMELDAIKNYDLDFLLVSEYQEIGKENDINFTLDIIEAAYTQTTLWGAKFGHLLFDKIEKKIIKNKKIQQYLNELRVLDYYSFVHCINVSILVTVVLKQGETVDEELAYFTFLSLLHDVGRIKMKNIFNKEGKLNEEEFKELMKHPQFSYELLKKAGFSDYELKAVFEHHEKHDGSGYPHRIPGKEIDDLAQLILIADVYNGLSSHRPYRRAFEPHEVLQIIEEEKNKSFGEKYVNAFFKQFNPYRVGTIVELNNGMTAVVKAINPTKKTLPVIGILSSQSGSETSVVNLAYQRELKIKKIIQSY